MRSRTVREGSVGLFFLLGLGLFAALVLWLRNAYFDNQSYKITVEFDNAAGLQIGTPVRYRGVTVGRVTDIQAGLDKVNVGIRINQPDLVIPRNVKIEANQSGLIGQNAVDIVPIGSIPANTQSVKPRDPNCKNSNLIVCNNENLEGQIGISLDQLIRLYSDEKFFNNINTAIQNASAAAVGITKLSRDLSDLSASAKQQLTSISAAANSVGRTADKFGGTTDKLNRTIDQFAVTANQISATANRTADQFSATANRIGNTADRIGNSTNRTADQLTRNLNQLTTSANRTLDRVGTTADQFSVTARQAGDLATNLNTLVKNNQASLVATLDNLSQTSAELRTVVKDLAPGINRVTQGELIQNLEKLSANAAQTSANLRDVTNTLNNPFTLLILQQTLESARATFQNAQKITSDLDDLTGDPAFRNNLRNLVNGLSNLVSSTNQLQQEVEVAQFLTPMAEATNLEIPKIPGTFQIDQAPLVNLSVPLTAPIVEDKPKPILPQPAAARE